jgi:hypothetical protein
MILQDSYRKQCVISGLKQTTHQAGMLSSVNGSSLLARVLSSFRRSKKQADTAAAVDASISTVSTTNPFPPSPTHTVTVNAASTSTTAAAKTTGKTFKVPMASPNVLLVGLLCRNDEMRRRRGSEEKLGAVFGTYVLDMSLLV